MDNMNNSNSSYKNSLCSEELKSSSISQHHAELQHQQLHHSQMHQQQQPKLISPHRQRAMSFLYCISKRLGRRVQHELVYNSQDDLRSSSTDSFSLSLDRGSSSEKHKRSSSIDLFSDGHSSRASSSSSSSRLSSSGADENEALVEEQRQSHRHSYDTHCYHVVGDEDDAQDELTKCTVTAVNSARRTPLKGLNLNRISISSVSRVLQHISSSSSSSASMRSLSCNSTPLRRTSMPDSKKSSFSAEKKSTDSSSSAANSSTKSKSSKPQQQRILRQPTSYVYLKGMSGLPTRRVPRSSVCSSYACR